MLGWLPRASGRITAARPSSIDAGQLVCVGGMGTVEVPPETGVAGFPEGVGVLFGVVPEVAVVLLPGVGTGDSWAPGPQAAPSPGREQHTKVSKKRGNGLVCICFPSTKRNRILRPS